MRGYHYWSDDETFGFNEEDETKPKFDYSRVPEKNDMEIFEEAMKGLGVAMERIAKTSFEELLEQERKIKGEEYYAMVKKAIKVFEAVKPKLEFYGINESNIDCMSVERIRQLLTGNR
ncbi:hypothetical protein SAMN05216391_11849 [Lachnospiraceae bacterium KHCPX20]|nr:hypothetical protein SAMN05216391_11849 [Lachnospiraceae bacterium KHCPX20]